MMLSKKIYCFLLLTLTVLQSYGQESHTLTEAALAKQLKVADYLYEHKSYYNTTDLYKTLYEANPKNLQVGIKMADAYFAARDYTQAVTAYQQILPKIEDDKQAKTTYAEAWWRWGLALKMNGRYEEAQKPLLTFIKIKSEDENIKTLQKRAKNEILSCDFALETSRKHYCDQYEVSLAEGAVNAGYSDFSPMLVDPQTFIFASLRSDSVVHTNYQKDQIPRVQLYQTQYQNEQWQEPKALSDFNHDYDHTANGTYSADGRKFYFTRCHENADKETICAIYYSIKSGNTWQKPVKLSRKVNTRKYTNTQPAFGGVATRKRKKYEVLYFVSDRPEGKGGKDIWHVLINASGKVLPPENCGGTINTPGDEVTPFYDTENEQLFFSSDYHFGLGGLDVIKAEGKLSRWGAAENMGLPVNSSYDDTYYSYVHQFRKGTLVSNRPGGKALESETCCDDIYLVEKIPVAIIQGIVLTKDTIRQVIEAANIGYELEPDSLSTNTRWITHSDKKGAFDIDYQLNKKQYLVVAKDGYQKTWVALDTIRAAAQDTTWIEVFLEKTPEKQPIPIVADKEAENPKREDFSEKIEEESVKEGEIFVLQNLYFDVNQSEIKTISHEELDRLVRFLKNHPKVTIEIAGYTDSQGDDAHNLQLSQERAEAVKTYLTAQGIDTARMQAKGYGKHQPIADNNTEAGRQQNRRTEVKITGGVFKK